MIKTEIGLEGQIQRESLYFYSYANPETYVIKNDFVHLDRFLKTRCVLAQETWAVLIEIIRF